LSLGVLAAALSLPACVSERAMIRTPPPSANEEVLGQVEGTAGGFMLLGVFPIGQNDRFQRAYDKAVSKVAGPHVRLTNICVWESWYWAYVGNGYVFHVEGTAVRAKPQDPAK
jgi:hypothetical protein